jgi:hypothetical protein
MFTLIASHATSIIVHAQLHETYKVTALPAFFHEDDEVSRASES